MTEYLHMVPYSINYKFTKKKDGIMEWIKNKLYKGILYPTNALTLFYRKYSYFQDIKYIYFSSNTCHKR